MFTIDSTDLIPYGISLFLMSLLKLVYYPGLTEELENERLNKATLDKNLRTKETELKDTVSKLEEISK